MLAELQGAVEFLEYLMKRYTQRRDARSGQRHTLEQNIRMAALEALLPEELERHCQLQRSRLDTYENLRKEVVLCAEGYVAPRRGQVGRAREDKDDPMDVGGFGQGQGRAGKGKGKNPNVKGKGAGNDGATHHQDKRTRRGSKDSAGIVGKQVVDRRTAGRSHCSISRTKDNRILLVKEKTRKASLAKVEEKGASPKTLEHLPGRNS